MPSSPVHTVEATFYAQVVPTFGNRWDSTQKHSVPGVTSIKVATITQQRPNKPQSKAVVIKLTLRFSEAAFMPLQPQAVIDIPDVLTQVGQTVVIEADDPSDGGSQAAVDYLAAVARGEKP